MLIDRLDRARDELVRVTRQVLRVPLETVDDTAHRYADALREVRLLAGFVASIAAGTALRASFAPPRTDAVLRDHVARPRAHAFGGAARERATLSSSPSGNSSMSLVDTR